MNSPPHADRAASRGPDPAFAVATEPATASALAADVAAVDAAAKVDDTLRSGILIPPGEILLSAALHEVLAAAPPVRAALFARLAHGIEETVAATAPDHPWTCVEYTGTDGSRIFRGGVGHSLVIDAEGRLWRARSYEDFDTTYDLGDGTCTIATLTPLYAQMRQYHPRPPLHESIAKSPPPENPSVSTTAELAPIAAEVKTAQDEARQIAPLTGHYEGFDVDAAYAVADLIHQARVREGATPVGRKIGFTNRALWPVYDVHQPIWAHVYDTTVVHVDGDTATCRVGRFAEPKIEPEIVLHFGSAPPAGGDLRAILASIDWIAHGFEIVQSHFPGWRFQVADTIADSSLHARLLVGPHQPVALLGPDPVAALEDFALDLHCDGALRETGAGRNVLDSPLAAIAHLIAVLARQHRYAPLAAGELVTTGTVTAAYPVRAGERWHTALRGIALPGLALEIVA